MCVCVCVCVFVRACGRDQISTLLDSRWVVDNEVAAGGVLYENRHEAFVFRHETDGAPTVANETLLARLTGRALEPQTGGNLLVAVVRNGHLCLRRPSSQ